MFISCTVWHHVYYDYLTVTSSVQLPGQLLKVRAEHHKNGRLQKYHYSKIQNAGDCIARTGVREIRSVREIGLKFGSFPHDPGGITCMCKYKVSSTGPNILEVYIIYLRVYMYMRFCHLSHVPRLS